MKELLLTDSENLELLKSQKSLSRVTSNHEILKKRVVSLEDEKMKFLSTLHDLKAENDDKDDEGYGLRRKLAKAKNELDSLENVRAKLTRAQDDLEDKNDKLIVVTSQKLGI
jgi:chromosome segregation ATPase